MEIFKLNSDIPYGSNTYALISGSEAALIDPAVGTDISELPFLNGITVKYLIVTHAHFDHILTLSEWREKTGADVIVGIEDAPALSNSSLNCYMQFLGEDKGYDGEYVTVTEGDRLPLCNEYINVISTPGHTQGSITLIADRIAVVGDTIFEGGGIGRFDLPGGDLMQLYKSIDRLRRLPDGTKIYSGHGSMFVL